MTGPGRRHAEGLKSVWPDEAGRGKVSRRRLISSHASHRDVAVIDSGRGMGNDEARKQNNNELKKDA